METPENQSLKELVAAAKAGDPTAQGELLQRHIPWLRAVFRLEADRTIREKESYSDLVQSAFLEILQNLDRFEYRDDAGFRAWLYGWVRNLLRNKRRHWLAGCRDRRREIAPSGSGSRWDRALSQVYATFTTPSELVALGEQIARVELALDRLSEDHRRVIMLSYFVQLPHAQIAAQMGRTVPATRTLLHRALARLSTLMDEGRSNA